MERKTIKEIYSEYANSKDVISKRKKDVAQRIKMLRVERKLLHEDVATATKINVMTYSGYENGHNNTPIEALVRIAVFYDVSLDYLCCRTDNKKGCYSESSNSNNEISELIKRIEKLEQGTKGAEN